MIKRLKTEYRNQYRNGCQRADHVGSCCAPRTHRIATVIAIRNGSLSIYE